MAIIAPLLFDLLPGEERGAFTSGSQRLCGDLRRSAEYEIFGYAPKNRL
jgi:hypothetical protein